MKWGGNMKILLIARDNIKKQKGNTLILFLLIALAVLMLYVGTSVLSNMDKVIDQRNETVNGADYFLFTRSSESDRIQEILEKRKEAVFTEREKALFVSGAKYFKKHVREEDADQINFFFQSLNMERKLSIIQIIDEGKEWNENSIILPYYMKVGMGYNTGETLNITLKGKIHSFIIYGFTEDIMFATPANISAEKGIISEEKFRELTKDWGNQGYIYRVKLKENMDSDEFLIKVDQVLKNEIPDYLNTEHISLAYNQLKYGVSITANIFMAVLTVFAVLLIFIALIIVHFNIDNSIRMNMKNIGILQASGYTSRQLAAATIVEFLLLGAVSMTVGLLCAKAASDIIGGILSSSIGLCWEMNFDPLSCIVSIVITTILIFGAVFLASRRYKQIAPLDALRSGIYTHNFKKNYVRLDKTKLPLNTAIGIKHILGNQKKNISICLIVMLLTFIANVSVSLYQYLVLESDKMIQIIGLEVADIAVYLEAGEKQSIQKKLESIDGIEQIIEFAGEDMIAQNGTKEVSLYCDIYDSPEKLRVNNIVKGRYPEYDNEIMLSTIIAEKLGVTVGEVMYLEMNEDRKDYLVVGVSQGINHLGRIAMLTTEGALRLNEKLIADNFHIYVKDSVSVSKMIDSLKESLADEEVTIYNSKKDIEVMIGSIIHIMKILCSVMGAVVAFVIALVLVLLVTTQLIREKRQLAIYKALGYTTRQLILQITMSYLPVFFIGTLLGCAVAFVGAAPSVVLSLTAFGIQKFNMDLSIYVMLSIIAVIIVWSELIIIVCSAKVRKITPYGMQQEI